MTTFKGHILKVKPVFVFWEAIKEDLPDAAVEELLGEKIGEKSFHSFNLAETLCKFK